MIKCNITACGTISRDASMRTTKEDKTFLTFPLRIVIQGKDGRNETVEISVSKEGAQKKVSSYRNGLRVEVAGTLFLKRRGEKLYFNLFADRIATAIEVVSDASTETILFAELPVKVQLKVTYTEPGLKGDTATNATKPATVETGATVRVPLFINQDETIEVDTRDGSYVGRVKA